jgi:hypothetical protein
MSGPDKLLPREDEEDYCFKLRSWGWVVRRVIYWFDFEPNSHQRKFSMPIQLAETQAYVEMEGSIPSAG